MGLELARRSGLGAQDNQTAPLQGHHPSCWACFSHPTSGGIAAPCPLPPGPERPRRGAAVAGAALGAMEASRGLARLMGGGEGSGCARLAGRRNGEEPAP